MPSDDPATRRLTGRRILITGGASGIGLATAKLFIAEGAKVALLDRDPDGLQAAIAALSCASVVADIANEPKVNQAVAQAAGALDGLDGLVNSAGISVYQSLESTDLATWQRTFDVNLTGSMLVARAALPHLKANRSATIVNVSSGIGLRPFAGRGAYAASKAGLIAWTKVLAQELAPAIRVNVICPGSTETPLMHAQWANEGLTAEQIAGYGARFPMGRQATSLEKAQAILYLTSDESSYVNGVALAVDGGRTLH